MLVLELVELVVLLVLVVVLLLLVLVAVVDVLVILVLVAETSAPICIAMAPRAGTVALKDPLEDTTNLQTT